MGVATESAEDAGFADRTLRGVPGVASPIHEQAAIRRPVALYQEPSGAVRARDVDDRAPAGARLVAVLPPLYPEWLGDRSFMGTHGCRFAYAVGEMARGIATPDMVIAAAQAGLMGFFGSAGLSLQEVEGALNRIQSVLGADQRHWGANLIHTPDDKAGEMAFAELMIARRVPAVSASAFMRLSPAIVWLSAKGLKRRADGNIVRARHVFAKVSRLEVARLFMSRAPENLLSQLVAAGKLTPEEASLSQDIPIAADLTAEADSGGHTDNRPLSVLLPQLIALARSVAAEQGFREPLRVGAAGGLGTPSSLAAAFAAGAAYVVTGSINQCTLQSGLSADARAMLAAAEPTDVAMAPAADMFEMGVKVQVLKRGTFFAQRGLKLYEIWRRYQRFEDMPPRDLSEIEEHILRRPVADIWRETADHFAAHDQVQLAKAEADPHHKMALVFRWYLFMGAQWARDGVTGRRGDYQIWCGPAMGGFNYWAKGSFLEDPQNRDCVQIALNLLEGAAHVSRAHQLSLAGAKRSLEGYTFPPRPLC